MKTLIISISVLLFASCAPAGILYYQPFIVQDTTGKLVKVGEPKPMQWVLGDTIKMIYRKK